MSFLSRHRTICEVLTEIGELAKNDGRHDIIELTEEALTYARAMSAKLTKYKYKEQGHG